MTLRSGALVVATLASVACTGDGDAGGDVAPEPVVCEIRFEAPPAFELREGLEDAYSDRVGTRRDFRDDRGRELHVFAGIRGEFGEGLPEVGAVELASGETVGLFGGPHDVWVLLWNEGDVCDPRVVLGNGFERKSFVAVLRRGGVVAATA